MAELLAPGVTQAASGTFSLAAGESATLYLVSPVSQLPNDALVDIQIRSASSQWTTLQPMTPNNAAWRLQAVGTFRVVRSACSADVGVDRN